MRLNPSAMDLEELNSAQMAPKRGLHVSSGPGGAEDGPGGFVEIVGNTGAQSAQVSRNIDIPSGPGEEKL
ncbi:unnamed protein product [Linum trigynum]|uniref:Uncharacterized protein n=1 Tax=Linum trigynum TaxID=586398 RepID=A0AAV2GX10_9ROSI